MKATKMKLFSFSSQFYAILLTVVFAFGLFVPMAWMIFWGPTFPFVYEISTARKLVIYNGKGDCLADGGFACDYILISSEEACSERR